jgi:hypothetical protein
MASAPPVIALGFPQRLANYVIGGGAEVNSYALGYQQAGRFGPDGSPESTDAQKAAYRAGLRDRQLDNSAVLVLGL